MGCDLHAVVCARSYEHGDGPEPLVSFQEPRDYRLFSAMADVRNVGEIVPVTGPRGLPDYVTLDENGSVWASGEIWMGDHSFSWLTTDEFAEAIRRADAATRGGSREPIYYAILALMRSLDEQGRPATLVFGFDN